MEVEKGKLEKGSDAWNVAQGYTQLKVLKPLVEMDSLVKIALYGVENIQESSQVPEQMKDQARIEAMQRLIDCLKEVIENSYFALNYEQQETLNKLKVRIEKVESVIDRIFSIEEDARTNRSSVSINEKHFAVCLKTLRTIKTEITTPLNDANLIFPSSEEVDLEALQNKIMFGG